MMIDLKSDTAFVHWTSEFQGSQEAVERSVWHHVPIIAYVITDSSVTLDAPAEWGEGQSPVRLQKTPDGGYEYHSETGWYRSVRAETWTHVIMTGRWTVSRGDGTGIFIAVLPIRQNQVGVEQMKQTVPVGRYADLESIRFRGFGMVGTKSPMPRVMNVDKNPAYPAAVEALKAEGTIPRRVRLRQCKYLNNVVEQDHRTVKKRVWLAKGYGPFRVPGGHCRASRRWP
jgi:hypothetical protein